jgi:hypothetical protein
MSNAVVAENCLLDTKSCPGTKMLSNKIILSATSESCYTCNFERFLGRASLLHVKLCIHKPVKPKNELIDS